MNSHNNGCTERVKMSRWSWRSLRISACAIANVPLANDRRAAGASSPEERGRGSLAEPAGNAALGADIRQPPFVLLVDRVAGDGREDLLEAVRAVTLQQLRRLALLDQAAHVHDRQALAVALGLLHQVRGHEDRRADLLAQSAEVLPHHPPRRGV